MVVDSENSRFYHKQLRSIIKEMSENKETSYISFHSLCRLYVVPLLVYICYTKDSMDTAEMYWPESHTQQTTVDPLGVSELVESGNYCVHGVGCSGSKCSVSKD